MVRVYRKVPICERAFSSFFVLWGILLIGDSQLGVASTGLFYGRMQSYAPPWAWGLLMVAIGAGRIVANHRGATCWRVGLSVATFVLLTVVASIAVYTGLWAATAPLASFVGLMAYWCHKALLRDIRLGL